MPDHIHLFVGLHPAQSISNLLQVVKGESSEWINNRGFVRGKFQWQEGYGAFSYSQSHVERVYNYILNQEQHHSKKTFKDEYVEFLTEFEIEHKPFYLFDWIEGS